MMTKLTGSTDPAVWQQSISKVRRPNTDGVSTWKRPASPKLEKVLRMATSIDTRPISRKALLEFSQIVEELSQQPVGSVATFNQ